jgi:DNA-directed RNA polymerase subunit beta
MQKTLQKNISKVNRKDFSKIKTVLDLPDLVEIQKDSYKSFLQKDLKNKDRKLTGLQFIFKNYFPIESNDKRIILDFVEYKLGEPKCTENEARERDINYSIPLKCTMRLIYRETGEMREKEIFMGDIPMMTDRGTFIINGSERVVVSQIHKSPGVVFNFEPRKQLFIGKIIPDKGAWLEFELDIKKELLYVKIDRKKRILITTFLRAIGYDSNESILDIFYDKIEVDIDKEGSTIFEGAKEIRLAHHIKDVENLEIEDIIYEAGSPLIPQDIEKIKSMGIKKIFILSPESLENNKIIIKCFDKEDIKTKEDAVIRVHSVIRPGEPIAIENAEKELQKLFFDNKRYDLGRVGRYKFNQKLDIEANENTVLSLEDITKSIIYLLMVYSGKQKKDDIDHLGNRRIRSVGELLVNQLKVGFGRMERAIKERMNTEDIEEITPQKLISIKPITAVIKEFFGSSQLSQFMDQTNPLAELTNKRRLNALGPGGLTRERAGFEVRDVHYTHYGRMCPIETPEGPSIGLILSLSNFAKVNEYGFLVTPYRKIENGKVTDTIHYLTAIEEEKYHIAQANAQLNADNTFVSDLIPTRHKGNFPMKVPEEIDYMDVSPKQIVSVSTSLIPFLEHDDANRALMGSNMQRQGVPLLKTESPLVGTGMEAKAAIDSGVCVLAKRSGTVIKISSEEIHIEADEKDEDNPVDIYKLQKYRKTNQNTCFNQRPIVKKSDKVKKREIIADGPAVDRGELALGKNILVAFMPWEGYNFEDAILISEKVVEGDTFTSIHIEEYEIEARETKLGTEKITKDIPNLSEEAFRDLEDNGIIRVGAKVEPGDILVGKVTPKGETDLTPEYKLLHSIFGEKAREVRDTSLRVPHGSGGTVIDIKVFNREEGSDLAPGVEELVKVYIAKKRKLMVGDKMAGRHGNKGVVSRIMPKEDMPFLPDGTPIDVVLNPLGVPSRMNIGQILETMLGWAGYVIGYKASTPVFDGASTDNIASELESANLPITSKVTLYNGINGEPFENEIFIGQMYIMKLDHLVENKLHARSTGPYSLVTQQPLGGKAQFGGQRLGEMEVWALEAYGAANTLQEFLTVKSDDMMGRAKIYESIVKGEPSSAPGIPESFNVLIHELRGLGLDLNIYDRNGKLLGLTDKDIEIINKSKNKG